MIIDDDTSDDDRLKYQLDGFDTTSHQRPFASLFKAGLFTLLALCLSLTTSDANEYQNEDPTKHYRDHDRGASSDLL